jgi:carbonic anhydrase
MPLRHLLANNKLWAAAMERERPGFFTRLSQQQNPRYMWVGCSDSRVPANQIVQLDPGEVFVHRNVANVVVHSDLNALSAVQYAVDMLRVKHVIICGHYGCGGVQAALMNTRVGLADNWIRHIQDVRDKHAEELAALGADAQLARLCELHVIEQVMNLAHSTVMKDAWARKQAVSIHGWIYDISDGVIKDLRMTLTGDEPLEHVYRRALVALKD